MWVVSLQGRDNLLMVVSAFFIGVGARFLGEALLYGLTGMFYVSLFSPAVPLGVGVIVLVVSGVVSGLVMAWLVRKNRQYQSGAFVVGGAVVGGLLVVYGADLRSNMGTPEAQGNLLALANLLLPAILAAASALVFLGFVTPEPGSGRPGEGAGGL